MRDRDIAIFDFDAKLPKRATSIVGKADLEPDASNLAIVLRNILQDERQREKLGLLIRDLLPFVDDLKVERFADKSLLISVKERFTQESYLPASFLSDGTIHLTALIIALYFTKPPVVIIEEPERNIHPHLISKVAALLADASRTKQVIVTTHSPELVKHARLEDLLLVRRDAEGFSRISRPAENEELKAFLENDLGVDELYVQNLLGVGE
jgi:predicted ATPase